MEALITNIFIVNWQRKLVSLLTALLLWFFINNSILETKTIPGVPVHIVKLPPDKTILGLLPNGNLSKRITLTLTGTKDVINELEPGDLQVEIDATMIDHDDWVAQISKKNLVSLNPSIDLLRHITQVEHSEYLIRLRPLVKAKVVINIMPPVGDPPAGYELLDIWPQRLYQTLSGAEEEIQALKNSGLDLTFDLSLISKSDLDSIKSTHLNYQDDEISFIVPNKWKQVAIPSHHYALEEINDPEAQNLRIDFLRKEFLPIGNQIPIHVFYPLKHLPTINPETYPLGNSESQVVPAFGIHLLTTPLYVKDVSRLFLNIVKENLEIAVIAAPKTEREILHWNVNVVDPRELEDTYVAFLTANSGNNKTTAMTKNREAVLRKRFREYVQRLILYTSPDQKLQIDSWLENNHIEVISDIK